MTNKTDRRTIEIEEYRAVIERLEARVLDGASCINCGAAKGG